MNYCKLTNQNLQTHNNCQWVIGEWKETSGKGELCTDGWLHCYTHPLLAGFLNRIHAQIQNPKLFEIEVGGKTLTDCGLKVGFTKMRLTKEIPLPQITDVQRVAFGILCAKEVETNKDWNKWADNWLNNTDRTEKSANAAANAAYSAYYAAYSAYYAYNAAYAAAYAAYAAADAAADAAANAAQSAARYKPLNLIEFAQKAMTYN